jgi:hypothetical protein
MATLIPSISSSDSRMTAGERRFALRLQSLLDEQYLCWYDVPVGPKRQHPDFLLLHPQRGLLVLEVKDWKLERLHAINPQSATILTSQGAKEVANPLEQARQYAFALKTLLQSDSQLVHPQGHAHAGQLLIPYAYGTVLSNITRTQFEKANLGEVLTPHLVICRDEMMNDTTPAEFQERLAAMFSVQFEYTLHKGQIDRLRWHLFPEIRIQQGSLFDTPDPTDTSTTILRVMDLQQEQLARSLGDGHRVIHGVAGSGKTLILAHRCSELARTANKPVLVVCFNVALAAKLEYLIAQRELSHKVTVRHFHGWCSDQLKLHRVSKPKEGDGYPGRLVRAVIQGVEQGLIPRHQHSAVLIDEGHDFEPEWLKLLAQMVDPTSNSLLLLYDDAQSIYGKKRSHDFSFAKLGIQARGRTTILRVNYRNTTEVLSYAFGFAKDALTPEEVAAGGDDAIPFVPPESAGRHGPRPLLTCHKSLQDEARHIAEQLRTYHEQGRAWNEMAVLYPARFVGEEIVKQLQALAVPLEWLQESSSSRRFNPAEASVKVMTLYSSKGLEFPMIAIAGVGFMPYMEDQEKEDAKLLYVGMTRATERLILTAHKQSDFVRQLLGHDRSSNATAAGGGSKLKLAAR